ILQWNCCGARSKLPQLQAISKNYDIICIQESLLSPFSIFSLRGFYTLRADITKPGMRGICILIRYNIVFSIIDPSDLKDDSVEMLAVEVSSDKEKFTIVNIYRHPNHNTPAQFYEHLMRCGDSKTNCILVGDYNTYHSQWGCSNTDRAGKFILTATEDHSYCNTWGSDHFPITVRVGTNLILRRRYAYKIKLDKKELAAFQGALANSYDSFMSHLPPDEKEAYSRLTNHLVNTAVTCCSSSSKVTSPGTVLISNERATPPWDDIGKIPTPLLTTAAAKKDFPPDIPETSYTQQGETANKTTDPVDNTSTA
ncbi:hypothetical protein ALC57_05020, partial [Trachymyrmex cornetzi]